MKTLYIECAMGAAGDMITAALYELLPDKAAFLDKMNALGLEGVHVSARNVRSCGINGTHMAVEIHGHEEEHHHHEHGHNHHHHHYTLAQVRDIIAAMPLPEAVRDRAWSVYDAIAAAESRAHGESVDMIHFHEVGALDAVADVVGACYALELLAPERVAVSPVRTGYGQVKCAHGIMPVPAPATAFLLEGVPSYAGDTEGEMCTPTGAALIRTFADEFGERPLMTIRAVGCGMGTRQFDAANCVRAFLGETEDELDDDVTELACNIDDMSAEALSCAMERIRQLGALDVSAVPAVMKKGRPGHILYVLTRREDAEKLARAVLRETVTNGVRFYDCRRMKLDVSFRTVETPYGNIRLKCSQGWDTVHVKPEYEDVAAVSAEHGVPFHEVWQAAMNNSEPQ
ncbi:MAG: nickel pincer cofactor biosynthesis protein LarC [Candidatus Heteroscillospira sp.]|jgi:uncharacterized protein (TIGR00299 family) protein